MKKAIRCISLLALLWSAYMLLFYLILIAQYRFDLSLFQNLSEAANWILDVWMIPALYFGIPAVPFLLVLLGILTVSHHAKYRGQRIFSGHWLLPTFVFCIAVLGFLCADIWTFELLS